MRYDRFGAGGAPLPPRITGDLPVLATIVALAGVVRFWGLGAQSFWFDELSSVRAARRDVAGLLTFVAEREGSPPGYFLVAWAWTNVLGDGEGALRALSALAGIAVVPVVYAVVAELSRRRAAARVAAVLVSLHPLLVWYSQEARPYSLLTLAGALSLLGFARSWTRGRRVDLLLWAVASAAAVGVHYFAAYLVAAEAASLMLRHRRRWKEVGLALVPSLAVGAALVPVVLEQRRHAENQSWITDFSLGDRLLEASRAALVGPNPPDDRLWLVAAVAGAAALVLGARAGQQRSLLVLACALGAASALLPLAALAVGVDMFLGRYVIAALLPLLVAVAVASTGAAGRRLGVAGVAVLCATWVVTVVAVAREPAQQRPPWREVAEVFEDGTPTGTGGRLLVLNTHAGLAAPLLHYVDDGARPLGVEDEVEVERIDIVTLEPSTAPCNILVGSACSLVFLGGPLPAALEDRFERQEATEIGQFTVDHFVADRPTRVGKEDVVRPQEVAGSLVVLRP
jgi:hypothetical protein